MAAKRPARPVCLLVLSIVWATMLATLANAGLPESQPLKAGGSLTVIVRERPPISYRVAATVAEILPNDVLVIEAHQSQVLNKYLSVYKLTGKVDPTKVAPDGSVLSEDIADLTIAKHLLPVYDCLGPF
jgi:hypothetical protein